MEKFKHVRPTKEYKKKAINYIKEFYEYNSQINGAGGLNKYLYNYNGWLKKLENDRLIIPNEKNVPTETFFLIRASDNEIIGMVNIRLALNEYLNHLIGNIGYSIRPTERRNGYNKINLYLALLTCQSHGLKEVVLGCVKDNIGSAKTIQALGGKLVNEFYEEENHNLVQKYIINVDESIAINEKKYSNYIFK